MQTKSTEILKRSWKVEEFEFPSEVDETFLSKFCFSQKVNNNLIGVWN